MRQCSPLALAGILLLNAGCATIESLPQSAAEVKLNPGRFEQGYWPRYTVSAAINVRSNEQVMSAARAALAENGFRLVRDDPKNLVLMGEHGPTPAYWNVVVGIYLIEKETHIVVRIVSVGSKDIGFIELLPNRWPTRILESLRSALAKRSD